MPLKLMKVILKVLTLSSPTDVTTILERHFVRWKAWQELATAEGMDPDPTELLSATYEVNAHRAEHAFRNTLNDILTTESACTGRCASLINLRCSSSVYLFSTETVVPGRGRDPNVRLLFSIFLDR